MWVNRDFEPVDPAALGGPLTRAGAITPPGAGGRPAPFLVREGMVAAWQGARERGDTGLEAASGILAFCVYEMPAVPDFSSSRFPDLAGLDAAARVQEVAARQAVLLSLIHTLGPRIGISLRYHCCLSPEAEPRLRCFLVGRAFGEDRNEAVSLLGPVEDAIARGLPPGYPIRRWAADGEGRIEEGDRECAARTLLPTNIREICEILKPEQILRPWHDPSLTGFPFWYYPLSFSASGGNDMLSLCRALTRLVQGADTGRLPASRCQDRSLVVDVTLVPAPPLTPVEQEEIAAWGAFAEKWGRDQKVPVAGGLYSKARTMEIAADPQAGEVKKAFGEQLARYGTPGQRAFLYAVRAVTLCSPGTDWGRGAARAAATALAGGALSAGSGCQILDVLPDHPAFERAVRSLHGCYVTPSVCNGTVWEREDAPETLRRLHRLALLGEISPFFRLPIPGREGCPGMPLDAGLPRRGAPTPGYASLRIGQFIEGDRVTGEAATVAVRDLAKHCLIVGTPGSGKTSLAFNLLTQLWRDHRIPFLVLEPAKTEYRSLLAVPGMGEDLLVFSVGNERVAPLRLNPFEILSGVPVAEHVAALTACFAGAFHLPDPLPMLLDEALREIYADRGWSEYGAGGDDPDLEPPTLADLHRKAIAVAERSGYRGDTGGNVRAMLQVRLQSLLRGPKGRCFGARRSLPVDLLLRRPVVFELESLTDEEKALTMMLLLVQVREHARATRKSGADLSHVVLVEEAHNLLGSGAGRGGGESADPKAMAVRYFTRMLAEMRSLGEGLIIADQLPTALAPEVVKNTNVKVMHRLTASDDREVLGRTMVLDPAQFEQAASLPPGLSYVFQEGWSRSRFVLEPDFKKETGTENSVTGDAEVRERMEALQEGDETVRRAFLPYSGCSATCRRCRPALRERMERWAAGKLPLLHQALRDFAGEDPIGISYPFYLDGIEAVADVADTVERACAQIHYAESVLPAVVMAQNSAAQTHR